LISFLAEAAAIHCMNVLKEHGLSTGGSIFIN